MWLPAGIKSSILSQALLILLVLSEVAGMRSGLYIKMDHVSHLGGYFAGALGAEALMYKAKIRRTKQQERPSTAGQSFSTTDQIPDGSQPT